MTSEGAYAAFYERLGREYPETQHVHGQDPRRFRIILAELAPFAARKAHMLDVGCNDGVYTIPYCRDGGISHGIDISPTLVAKAQARAACLPATFEVADIEAYRSEIRYDLVLMSEVLEHVRNPSTAVENAVRLTKPGGHLLLSTPSARANVPALRYLLRLSQGRVAEEYTVDTDRTVLGEQYRLGGFQYRHDHYYLTGLRRWLERYGLRTVRGYTAVQAGTTAFSGLLSRLEPHLDLRRVPLLNLFGLHVFLLMKRRD